MRIALALLSLRAALGALCDAQAGLNCWGNDLADGGVVSSAAACCALCAAHSGCSAWTWDRGKSPTACWLKSSCAGARNDSQAVSGVAPPPPPGPPAPPPADYHNGVSIGGWLLTEPSWMSDQAAFSAPAEADLVARLRAEGGGAFAVQTMRNHWAGYVPDEALDALAAFGVTHARLPIGYWITEAPVLNPDGSPAKPGATPYDFGFNHEGFVTGGLNYLEATVARLKARGMRALVDLHAMPGGSSQCQSYAGWQVDSPLFWQATPPASNATPIAGCGGAGPYRTTRGSARPWMAVGEDALAFLGDWVVSLERDAGTAGTVVGLEVVNEPGLGFNGVMADIERLLSAAVPKLQATFLAAGLATNVTVNFIGPNDQGAGAWLAAQIKSGAFNASQLRVRERIIFPQTRPPNLVPSTRPPYLVNSPSSASSTFTSTTSA